MSRVMTISELYALLIHEPKALEFANPSATRPVQLNRHSAVLWSAPAAKPLAATVQPRATRLAERVMLVMEQVAEACGITEVEAWTEAAQNWIVQRQDDMALLETPHGQELAAHVRQSWSAIDAQLSELRGGNTKTQS